MFFINFHRHKTMSGAIIFRAFEIENLRIETHHHVRHERLVAFHALVLAEAKGSVSLKNEERVKQPRPVHAGDRLFFLQEIHGGVGGGRRAPQPSTTTLTKRPFHIVDARNRVRRAAPPATTTSNSRSGGQL